MCWRGASQPRGVALVWGALACLPQRSGLPQLPCPPHFLPSLALQPPRSETLDFFLSLSHTQTSSSSHSHAVSHRLSAPHWDLPNLLVFLFGPSLSALPPKGKDLSKMVHFLV